MKDISVVYTEPEHAIISIKGQEYHIYKGYRKNIQIYNPDGEMIEFEL